MNSKTPAKNARKKSPRLESVSPRKRQASAPLPRPKPRPRKGEAGLRAEPAATGASVIPAWTRNVQRFGAKRQGLRRPFSNRRSFTFAGMKGRVVEKIEFYSSPGQHSISIDFDDRKALTLMIDLEPRFSIDAELEDWKGGNSRLLRRWPRLYSKVPLSTDPR